MLAIMHHITKIIPTNYDDEYKDYNENNRNINNEYIPHYVKYANCPIPFEDQIFLVYKHCGFNKPLTYTAICHQLSSIFNTQNVEYTSDIKQIRFLHITGNKTFHMFLQIDDICPNGFECRINRRYCGRVHCISKHDICKGQYFKDHCQCNKIHYHHVK